MEFLFERKLASPTRLSRFNNEMFARYFFLLLLLISFIEAYSDFFLSSIVVLFLCKVFGPVNDMHWNLTGEM